MIDNAYNGREAIDKYAQMDPKPDIIILDYFMPLLNGLETAKIILKYDSGAKIIFVSTDRYINAEAVKLGAKKYITKPFQMQALIDMIRELED